MSGLKEKMLPKDEDDPPKQLFLKHATKQKLFNSNRPKILLETAASSTIKWFTFMTYMAFIIGISCDLVTIIYSFRAGAESNLSSDECPPNFNPEFAGGAENIGCSTFGENSTTWKGVFKNTNNVISTQLNVKSNNYTNFPTDSHDLHYNVRLYACYHENGCSSIEIGNDEFDGYESWLQVFTRDDKKIYDYASSDTTKINLGIFPNTYQFQESVPSKGLIKSYFMEVVYTEGFENLYLPYYNGSCQEWKSGILTSACDSNYLFYTFSVVHRSTQFENAAIFFRILTFFSTLVALCVYFKGVFYRKYRDPKFTILTEQWWILFYIVGVVLYQNPVYVSILLDVRQTPELAEAVLLLDQLMQNVLFFIWLLFADSIYKSMSSTLRFYLPKVLLISLMFIFEIIVIRDQFSHNDPVQSLSAWSPDLQRSYCIFCLMILLLQWVWLVQWLFNLYSSGKVLSKLPYMNTRYLQLSNRFFTLQSTSVFLYYLVLYLVISILIYLHIASNFKTSLLSLTDNVNTLFAQQTLMFGKSLLFSIYAIILAFCYLPADYNDENWLLGTLLTNYVLTEDEIRIEKATRLKSSKKLGLKKLLLNPLAYETKMEVFCVHIGLRMRELSFQSYYDKEGLVTASHFPGGMHLEDHDFEFIDALYDPGKEVFCFIARDLKNRSLCVCFRGTASKKQMDENLKYKLREIDPFSNRLTALDLIDGLSVDINSFYEDLDSLKEFYQMLNDAENDEILNSTRFSSIDSKSSLGSFNEHDNEHKEATNQTTSLASLNINKQDSFSDTSVDRSQNIKKQKSPPSIFTPIVDGAQKVVHSTKDLALNLASKTPGLKNFVNCQVHTGFYDSYEAARGFVHAVLRRELLREPCRVYFTGHSLGGALATYASMDVAIHTIPRVYSHLRMKNNDYIAASRAELVKPRRLSVSLYTFGSPRAGNPGYADVHEAIVSDSFRIVCDGDLVTSLPPGKVGYKHLKTEVLIDKFFSGSIIVDPSFVEKRFRSETKSSVSSHSLFVYHKALLGVKQATEYMHANIHEYATEEGYVDMIQLALDTEKQLAPLRNGSNDRGVDNKTLPVEESPIETYLKHSVLEEASRLQLDHLDDGATNPLTSSFSSQKLKSYDFEASRNSNNMHNKRINDNENEDEIANKNDFIALEKQYEDEMRKSMAQAIKKGQNEDNFLNRTKTFLGDF